MCSLHIFCVLPFTFVFRYNQSCTKQLLHWLLSSVSVFLHNPLLNSQLAWCPLWPQWPQERGCPPPPPPPHRRPPRQDLPPTWELLSSLASAGAARGSTESQRSGRNMRSSGFCFSSLLGTCDGDKTDEFSEKLQGGGVSFLIQKFILQIWYA